MVLRYNMEHTNLPRVTVFDWTTSDYLSRYLVFARHSGVIKSSSYYVERKRHLCKKQGTIDVILMIQFTVYEWIRLSIVVKHYGTSIESSIS